MAKAERWCDLDILFGKHAPQLSEIFREALQSFMEKSGDLITSPIPGEFFEQHTQRLASAVLKITDEWIKR